MYRRNNSMLNLIVPCWSLFIYYLPFIYLFNVQSSMNMFPTKVIVLKPISNSIFRNRFATLFRPNDVISCDLVIFLVFGNLWRLTVGNITYVISHNRTMIVLLWHLENSCPNVYIIAVDEMTFNSLGQTVLILDIYLKK